jgi:biopolymer transport protein ExbD
VNGEPATTDDAVQSLARDAINRDPETRAVINADGAVPHRRVIELLDVLKSAGIAHVAFGALPPEQRAK